MRCKLSDAKVFQYYRVHADDSMTTLQFQAMEKTTDSALSSIKVPAADIISVNTGVPAVVPHAKGGVFKCGSSNAPTMDSRGT